MQHLILEEESFDKLIFFFFLSSLAGALAELSSIHKTAVSLNLFPALFYLILGMLTLNW